MQLLPKFRAVLRLALAVGLALATLAAVSSLNHLAYSETRDAISDTLLMPGALLGVIFSPTGIHGSHPMLWVAAVVIGNVLFYSFLWWLLLRWVPLFRLPSNNRWRGP